MFRKFKLLEIVTEYAFHDGIRIKVFDFWFHFIEKIGFSKVIFLIILNFEKKNWGSPRPLFFPPPLERGAGGCVTENLHTPLSPLFRGESKRLKFLYIKLGLRQLNIPLP